MKCYEELMWRGLIQDMSAPELADKLNEGGLTFYIGTDPTGDSLHIGHYSSFLIAKRLARFGHHPILLVGGATGLIGDPKPDAERPMISYEEVAHNVECLKKQAEELFECEVVNNYDWTKDISVIDFLRDYGKYFNVNYMLAKDKVKSRMETGITFTEFSYMILQALDFLHLYETRGCSLQVAGSDQWGNITSGIELIRKKLDKTAYGMVAPLVTDSTGKKFGKTEGNALWLDINKTSSYQMYQYLINLEDSMIIEYLKKLTFIEPAEIEEIAKQHAEAPHLRIAQKRLAKEIITDIHGEEEFRKAVEISEAFFSGNFRNLSKQQLRDAFQDMPVNNVEEGTPLVDALVNSHIASSKREAREFIKNGSVSINGDRCTDLEKVLAKEDTLDGETVIIRKGKKNYFILKV